MFDRSIGNFPADQPFDFDRHRASPFASSARPKPAESKRLSALFKTAIEFIIEKNPTRPTATLTPEQTKHAQDVKQLEWLMSSIHIPTIDDYVDRLPHSLSEKAIHVWEGVNGIVSGSFFHLHDSTAFAFVREFHIAFGRTLAHCGMCHAAPSGTMHLFTGHGNLLTTWQQEAWNSVETARADMAAAFKELLRIIRSEYLEVDLEKTNAAAWEDYKKHHLSI